MKRLALAFTALTAAPLAWSLPSAVELEAEERVLLGGEDAFLTLRHLRLQGTQREIGRRLFEIARERHGYAPRPVVASDVEAVQARRAYFAEHAPAFVERMRGVADGLGLELEAADHHVASLSYGTVRASCTVAYYPPDWTAWGTGLVSRNYDFSTGDFRGRAPAPGEVPVTSAPYLLETHPEDGFATIAMCAYDLLGGVIDGMNSEGLVIALLADDEVVQTFGPSPASGPQAGFGVLQIGRHILETCRDVDEAKAAFERASLYYTSIPCHYLVADRHGRSFVWENDRSMEGGYAFDGGGEPQVTTNFMRYLHDGESEDELPRDGEFGSFSRFRRIHDRLRALDGPVTEAFVKETAACVAPTLGRPGGSAAPGRTLWHTLYYPEERRVEIDVYLGESHAGGRQSIERSGWVSVVLGGE